MLLSTLTLSVSTCINEQKITKSKTGKKRCSKDHEKKLLLNFKPRRERDYVSRQPINA